MAIEKELADGIKLMQNGDEVGFNILYSHTYNYVYGRARLIMQNEEDALDLTQETYIRAYKGIGALEDINNVFAWLGSITYNQGMTALKKKRDVLVSEEAEGVFDIIENTDSDLQPEESAEAKATSKIVMDMIDELPELQRAAVMAYYYDDMRVEDIATAFECSTGTIKSRLNYARKFLKEKVMEHEKKNRYKLCSVSPAIIIAALKSLLATKEYSMTPAVASSVYSSACGAVGVAPSVTSVGTVASAVTTVAAKAGLSLGTKLAIALTSVAAIGAIGTGIIVHNINNNNSPEATTVTTEADYFEWELNGDTLIIRGKGAMPDYSSADYPIEENPSPFAGNDAIKNIIIEEGITSIGPCTFEKCPVINLTLPTSLKKIDWCAFADCTNLKNIDSLNNVETIEDSAFYGCSSLETLEILSDSVSINVGAFAYCSALKTVKITGCTMLEDSAFEDCSSLESINISGDLTTINEGTFSRCTSLKEIVLPSGITSIEVYCFSDCVLLESIVIPDSVTTINSSAFVNCPSLRSITIPASVTSISPEAFIGSTYLKTIRGTKGSAAEAFAKEHGIIFIDINTNEPAKPSTPTSTSGTIEGTDLTWKLADNTLTISGEGSIPSFSEFYISNTSVKPDSPWYQYADEIYTVIFEEGITDVGAYTFYGFDNLTEVIFPESMSLIDGYSFSYCKNLRTVTIPGHIDQTGIRAFYACTALESVTFEKGIRCIGPSSFGFCANLTDISLPEGLEVIDDGAFAYCFKLITINIPNGTQSLVRNAFRWCIRLTDIEIPASVTSIAPTALDAKYIKTIYGTASSAAENFTKENNIIFIEK